MPNKERHVVIDNTSLVYSDVSIGSDKRLWIAGKRYFQYEKICPLPETYVVNYNAGTAMAMTVTLGSTGNSAGNSIGYTLNIRQTNPFTGVQETKSKKYTTAATGTVTVDTVCTGLQTAYSGDADFTVTASTCTLLITGTVNGGMIDAWMSTDSNDAVQATYTYSGGSNVAYVSPKGTAAHIASIASQNPELTFTYTTYNLCVLTGVDASGDNLHSPADQKETIYLWFYSGSAGIGQVYAELTNILQGDSTYTSVGELISKIA